MQPPAIVFRMSEARKDCALLGPGDRKQIVTQLYSDIERPADQSEWKAPASSELPQVLIMKDTESAVFTENARQERHYHAVGTEMYLVLEGEMRIDVGDTIYSLTSGDLIVVNPKTGHEVKREGSFLCRVITVNCQGPEDKFVASAAVNPSMLRR